jgi:hypothetical protein
MHYYDGNILYVIVSYIFSVYAFYLLVCNKVELQKTRINLLAKRFKNDSDFLRESGGSGPHEDQDLELKKQELKLCQTGPKSRIIPSC